MLSRFWADAVRKHSSLGQMVKGLARMSFPEQVAFLEYPVPSRRRWTASAPHAELREQIDANRKAYRQRLEGIVALADRLGAIPVERPQGGAATEPYWNNTWFTGLDAAALYGMIAAERPSRILEIGSGNSTKFARRAIGDLGLKTSILSIDPQPRAEIDALCDEVIRQPLESVSLATFDRLQAGDFLFIDSSHSVSMNSDATAIYLEILPRLRPGVIVQIHDIYLPYDYPESWIERYYSEQYLLAAHLLSGGGRYEVLLPNAFISEDAELGSILAPLWKRPSMRGAHTHGSSFWLRIREVGNR